MNFGMQTMTTNYQITPELQTKIDEINSLAYQFNTQKYVTMIVNIYKTNPKQARTECKRWMDMYPLVLSDLGALVKAELDKGGQ